MRGFALNLLAQSARASCSEVSLVSPIGDRFYFMGYQIETDASLPPYTIRIVTMTPQGRKTTDLDFERVKGKG